MSTTSTLWSRCEALGPQIHEHVVLKMIAKRWIIQIDDHPICYIYHADTGRKMTGPSWVADLIIQHFEARASFKVIDPSECAHPGADIRERLAALWKNLHQSKMPSGVHTVSGNHRNGMATLMRNGGLAICDLHCNAMPDNGFEYTLQMWDEEWTLERIEALFVEQAKQSNEISAFDAQVADMKQRYPNADIIARMEGNVLRAVSVNSRSGVLFAPHSESTVTIEQTRDHARDLDREWAKEFGASGKTLAEKCAIELLPPIDESKPYQVAYIAEAPKADAAQITQAEWDEVKTKVDVLTQLLDRSSTSYPSCTSLPSFVKLYRHIKATAFKPKSLDESDAPAKLQP